jgi:hypothetical protein
MITRPSVRTAAFVVAAALVTSACGSQDATRPEGTPAGTPASADSVLTLGYQSIQAAQFPNPYLITGVQLAV